MKKIDLLEIINFFKPIFYYLALIMVPLGMSFFLPIYSPFTMIKSAWFQVLAALMLFSFLLHFWHNYHSGIIKINKQFIKILIPWFLFLLMLLVTNIFSSYQIQSFFGSYDRQTGFLFYFTLATWVSMIVYYFSGLDNNIKELENAFIFWQTGVRRSAVVMCIVSTLVAIYACLQFVGLDFIVWQEGQLLNRSIATLGQPNFLGSFLLFGLIISSYLFYLNKIFLHRFFLFVSFFIQLLALVASGSRSAWLSFIVAFVTIITLLFWSKLRKKTIILAAGILFVLISFFIVFSPARFKSLFLWQEGSLGLRSYFYSAAPHLLADHLLIGTGLENGGEAIVSSYQPDWGVFMKINGYSDKLHNSLLDILLQLGVIGFCFYILLYLFVLKEFLRLWKRPQTKDFAIFVGAALIAYSVSLLFGLSDVANIFYFWVLTSLGLAANLIFDLKQESKKNIYKLFKKIKSVFLFRKSKMNNNFLFIFISFVLACVAILQIYLSLTAIRADHYFLNLYKQSLNKEYFTAELLYQYILEDSHQPVYRAYYQRAYAFFILEALQGDLDLSTLTLLKNTASKILNDLPNESYDNLYTKAYLECNLNNTSDAMVKFQYLLDVNDSRPAVYVAQGDCMRENNFDLALGSYDQSLLFLPDINDSRLVGEHKDFLNYYNYLIYSKIGELYYSNQKYKEALNSYERATYFYPQDLKILDRIAQTAFYLKDNQLAYQNLEHAYLRNLDIYWVERLIALAHSLNDEARLKQYIDLWQSVGGREFDGLFENFIFP